LKEQDGLIEGLWATPVATNAGRAAKVRILLRHTTTADWRQGLTDGDSDQERMIRLLAELCGESLKAVAAVALRLED
jgi:hypothetical protein